MEELRGTPWTGQGVSGGEATENEKAKVWSGLADILIELEKHPFPKAGSLCFQSSEIEVSAVASDRFLVLTIGVKARDPQPIEQQPLLFSTVPDILGTILYARYQSWRPQLPTLSTRLERVCPRSEARLNIRAIFYQQVCDLFVATQNREVDRRAVRPAPRHP
jgi:hypothetical protein